MTYNSRILWSSLPHNRQVGYGREGLVLQLSETAAIKIYSPNKSYVAVDEIVNSHKLDEDNFLVAKARELVQIEIDTDDARLPKRCEHKGVDLFNVVAGTKVFGVVRDYFPGEAFGMARQTPSDYARLEKYLQRLHNYGFAFQDGICADFIATNGRVALVDTSTLVTIDDFEFDPDFDKFDKVSAAYRSRVYDSLKEHMNSGGVMDSLGLLNWKMATLWLKYQNGKNRKKRS